MDESTRRPTAALTVTSLLSIFLCTVHLAEDVVRGFEKGGVANLTAVPIVVVWLYGTVILAGRRAGYAIILLGSLLAMVVPYIHMSGRGVGAGSRIAGSEGALFFVWTLLALGAAGLFGVVLAVRGLWGLRRRHLR